MGKKYRKWKSRQKAGYDLRSREAVLEPGDRVLVKVLAFEGRHKLADRWEPDVYIVQSQPNRDIPVYTILRENGEGKSRTLHRNHLLPIGTIPLETDEIPIAHPPRPVPRARKSKLECGPHHQESVAEIVDSPSVTDSSDEEFVGMNVPSNVQRPPTQDKAQPSENVTFVPGPRTGFIDVETSESEPEDEPATAVQGNITLPDPEIPIPRRSTRNKRQPNWMTSGEFVCSQQPVGAEPEWKVKAMFLMDITSSVSFRNMTAPAQQALLNILTC
ncbi:uncharacterized protein LOC117319771 [Pecten maximus]|uniref:uncharacterized protein LOC117319771 n=1 Tax=Pecten maximus TaxID=6579 RepID=UPI0014587125|nr:uncharacterized protein LOC117319771 [Pecten maximus]